MVKHWPSQRSISFHILGNIMTQPKSQTIGRNVRLTPPTTIVMGSVDDYLLDKYGKTRDDLSSRAKMLLTRLEQYIVDVSPSVASTQQSIIKAQDRFYLTIVGILESDATDALLMWDVLMFFGAKHEHDIFNDRTACRFYNGLSIEKQQPFLSLMTLIISTANVRKRELALRTHPLSTITAKLGSEKARANLAAYYASHI